VFNDSKSQFCLCYNNGIKTFSGEDFKELYTSNSIGSISMAAIVHELNMVIFVGSDSNEMYSNKKIVIYDLINQKDIYSTPFQSDIKSLKIINKFLIIGFDTELKIFSLEKKDTIIPIKEIQLPTTEFIEIWDKSSSEIITLSKVFLVYFFEKKLHFRSYIGNEWNLNKNDDIKSPVFKIQNIFYIQNIDTIFIPDETAYYIYGINPDDGKQKYYLYRGKYPGFITSIVLLNKNYLAVNNINRKIHIFDINEKTNNYNIGNLIGGMIYGSYISPFMRIPYDKIIKKNEGEFYDNDFQKKGALLASETDGIVLKIVAYNGYAYNIRINFLKKDFEVIYRKKICVYDINDIHEEPVNESEPCSYNSIFDKQKKGGEEDKFVVLK
jgi:hypothetical protein